MQIVKPAQFEMSAAMRTPVWLMGHLPLNTTCSNTKQSHKIGKETKVYILAIFAATLNGQHNIQKNLGLWK